MKNILLFCGLFLCFLNFAYAQSDAVKPQENKEDRRENKQKHEQKWQEKYNSASPEEKQKMEQRKAIQESLSPQQKEDFKQEMQRHKAKIKEITGFEPDIR
jgi:flagellar biosynthesis component FlhA